MKTKGRIKSRAQRKFLSLTNLLFGAIVFTSIINNGQIIAEAATKIEPKVKIEGVTTILDKMDLDALTAKQAVIKEYKIERLNSPIYKQSAIISVAKDDGDAYAASIVTRADIDSNSYYQQYKEHCKVLTDDTADMENLISAYSQVGYLYETEKIDVYTFRQILNMLEYTYSQHSVFKDKTDYLKLYMSDYYTHSWDNSAHSDYISTLLGYGNMGNPYDYETTPAGEVLLATAYAVGSSWARGESTSSALSYSQTNYTWYKSIISDKEFEIRPDCTGFCYTVLKELGCQSADAVSGGCGGFYSGTMVDACEDGTFASDPKLEVIPFEVDKLIPGDIMVTADDKTVSRWGTNIRYGSNGHAEIFVGFPNGEDHTVTDSWNWGGHDVVSENWPKYQDSYIPQRKKPSYNYSYIIRYVGEK